MVEEHKLFVRPDDLNQKIWRYVDFTKFIELINSQHLYFSRTDFLGDAFEGSLPMKTYENRKHSINKMIEHGKVLEDYKDAVTLSNQSKNEILHTYINCWHINNHESAAMWKLYLKTNEGIAIQSTSGRLINSMKNDTERIFVGMVKYIDYEIESFDWTNGLNSFIHKRKSFEHEKEFRALIWNSTLSPLSGLRVRVDLRILVENIYICPDSPKWFKQLVDDIIKHFNYDIPIIQSNLSKDPIY